MLEGDAWPNRELRERGLGLPIDGQEGGGDSIGLRLVEPVVEGTTKAAMEGS